MKPGRSASRASRSRGAEKKDKGTSSHGRKRQAAEPERTDSNNSSNYNYPSPPQSTPQYGSPNTVRSSASSSASASAGPTISAMLNPGDFPEHTAVAAPAAATTTQDRGRGASSKMALHHALSPAPPTATRTDNSFASVVLSDQPPAAVPGGDVYTHRPREPYAYAMGYSAQQQADDVYHYASHPYPSVDRRASGSQGSRGHRAGGSHGGHTARTATMTPPIAAPARPASTTAVSSPAFSAPNTPGPYPAARLASVGTASFGSSENEYDDGESMLDSVEGSVDRGGSVEKGSASRDTSAAPAGGKRSGAGGGPGVQRERNRVAATKCRAKSKAVISKLEEDERIASDRRESLSAERTALMNEVLSLRMELLKHGHCESDGNIQSYIRNAARTIGQSGGRNPIWGPDGSGQSRADHE